VDSIIIAHPGSFTLAQAKAIKVPASWVCAEGTSSNQQPKQISHPFLDDIFFPDSLRDKCEAVFAERNGKEDFLDYEFIVYKGYGLLHDHKLNLLLNSSSLFIYRDGSWVCNAT